MGNFYANKNLVNSKMLFVRYSTMIEDLSYRAMTIQTTRISFEGFSGFGIEKQASNLTTCFRQLLSLRDEIKAERDTICSVLNLIDENEKKAVQILKKDEGDQQAFVLAKLDPVTRTISHIDIGKIKNQLKFYSQDEATAKRLYELFEKAYKTGEPLKLTEKEYQELKSLVTSVTSRESYYYSEIKYFDGSYKHDGGHNGSLRYSTTDTSQSGKAEATLYHNEGSYDISSMEISLAAKYGDDYQAYTIKLSNVNVKGEFDLASFNIDSAKYIIKQIKSGNIHETKINELLSPYGISFSSSASAISITSQDILYCAHGVSYYLENNFNIGELTAEASFSGGTGKAKLGYSIASIESAHGVISNDFKGTVSGKARLGQEYGFEYGKEVEVSAGLLSLSMGLDDGFDYYVWQ